MLTQENVLELAKQGNPQAIATLISRSLKAQGVTAKAGINGNCLWVMLEAKQVPNQQVFVQCIRRGLSKLDIKSIKTVQVSGKQVGKVSPAWIQDFKLVIPSPSIPDTTPMKRASSISVSGTTPSIVPHKNLTATKSLQGTIQDSPTASDKSIAQKKIKLLSQFHCLLNLKSVYRALVFLLGIRISFDILFVFYSLTWASSLMLIRLLDVVDTTGALAYFLYSLFRLIDWLWVPIELVGNWIYLIVLVVTLVWLHRLHAKLKVLFSGYPITPWGAIARFLIPFYSIWGIWNLFATLAKKLQSQTGDLATWGTSLHRRLLWLYIPLLVSIALNITEFVYKIHSTRGSRPETYPWLFVISNAMNLLFSIIFIQMAKLIRKAIVGKSLQISGQHI